MIGFVLTAAAVLACGLAIAQRWRDESGPAERALAGAVIGLAIWLAANWLLAITHLFTRPALIVLAIVMALVAAALSLWFDSKTRNQKLETRRAGCFWFQVSGFWFPRPSPLLIPLALWTLFALWKGVALPPQTHDALAYHLPKAAMIAQAHGFEHFAAPDPRIASLPANYELLLADVLVMSGSDTCTEWLGTLAFLLFLCATAAVAERWWPEHPHRAATALAAAGAPLLLLHSTADKNDVLLCALCIAAILWVARGGRVPMLLAVVALAMAGGTKPTAAAVLVAVAPFVLLRWRSLRLLELAGAAILAFLLLGGIAYIDIFGFGHAAAGGAPAGLESSAKYGDFANLWRVPLLALLVPFEPMPNAVWVPWRHEYWYWPHYEIFFSHYGALVSILVVFAAVFALRRNAPNRERTIGTIAALLAAALILPMQMRPLGMFAAMPRYVAFVVPVIVCWSVPPMLALLRRRSPLLAHTFVAAIAAFFLVSAVDVAVNDRMAPLRFVRWAARHPGDRHIWFMPNRAASVADRYAGPNDTIAIDGGFDTWTYPAYGAHVSRRVVFINGDNVPPDARWVVIDHAYNRVWRNIPDMGKFWNFVGRGKPSASEERLQLALERDPRFAEVFYDARLNQAVFKRIR